MLERLLNKAGYTDLHFANSANETFKKLGIDKYDGQAQIKYTDLDLILLDIMMPDIDGIEVCKRINDSSHVSDIPVIIVTALNDSGFLERAFQAGAIDFITKPVKRLELLARVGSAIKLSKEKRMRIVREQELEKTLKLLEETNKKFEKLATIDELTQLANRRLFDETMRGEWRRANRNGYNLSIILLDIDYFKNFNDAYGHQAGDECLKAIAKKLKFLMMRPGDFAARYGGEEFAVILPETDLRGAHSVAEKIRQGIEELKIPHCDSKVAQYVTVSLGVASADLKNCQGGRDQATDDEIKILIEHADEALYKAKDNGRNTIALMQP